MSLEVLDFNALWDLIESRFTKKFLNRHIIAIHKICDKRTKGVFIDELPQFTKLLKLCTTHIDENRLEFLAPTINLLQVTMRPLIMSKSFEKIESFDGIKKHFEAIKLLLSKKFMFVTLSIAKGLQIYIRDVLDFEVVNESGLIQELVDSLCSWCYGARWKIGPNATKQSESILNIELSLELIRAIKILSHSKLCSLTLVKKANLLDLKIIFDAGMNDVFLSNSIEILWNLIEQLPFCEIAQRINVDFMNIFSFLLTMFEKEIKLKNKAMHKSLRNCILCILLILSKHKSMHQHFESSQIIKILLSNTQQIVENNNENRCYFDFEFVCIACCIIQRIAKCFRILSHLICSRFLDTMTDALFSNTTKHGWTPTQIAHIRIHSVFMFDAIFEFVPNYFFKRGIISKLFLFFVEYQTLICTQHQSIKKQIDAVSVSLLRFLAKCVHKRQNIVNVPTTNLFSILLRIINHVSFELTTRTDAVLIVAALNNEEQSADVIECVCSLIQSIPSTLSYYQQFEHSLIWCLKRTFLHNSTYFFDQNGVSLIIEFVQKAQPTLIEHAMSFLLQICSNNKEFICDEEDFESVLIGIWEKCQNDLANDVNLRIMQSIYCLYEALKFDKMNKIKNHFELRQGEEWNKVYQSLHDERVQITFFDADKLKLERTKYEKLKSQMKVAEDELEQTKAAELKENLHDLMNKLNLYKAQNKVHIKQSQNENNSLFASNIKLNKDQKDEIVAKSLQIDETMQKVLG